MGCSLKNINVNIFYDENDDKMDEVDEYDDEMVIPRIPVIIVFSPRVPFQRFNAWGATKMGVVFFQDAQRPTWVQLPPPPPVSLNRNSWPYEFLGAWLNR